MGIVVSKVTLGSNYDIGSALGVYRRTAIVCPVGTTLFDGSSLICKSGGLAWFVSPKSTEIICSAACFATVNTLTCNLTISVTGIDDWFIPTDINVLNNPGYVCRDKWLTCTRGVGISTNYAGLSTQYHISSAVVAIPQGKGSYAAYCTQFYADGSLSSVPVGETTECAVYRRIRCVTY